MAKSLDPDLDSTSDQYDDEMEDYDMLEDVYYDDFVKKARKEHRIQKENEEHEVTLSGGVCHDEIKDKYINSGNTPLSEESSEEEQDEDDNNGDAEYDDDEEEEQIAAQFAALDGSAAIKETTTEPEEAIPVGFSPENAMRLLIDRNKDLVMSWADRSGAIKFAKWLTDKGRDIKSNGRVIIPLYSAVLLALIFLW